jgi:hypothetical protein
MPPTQTDEDSRAALLIRGRHLSTAVFVLVSDPTGPCRDQRCGWESPRPRHTRSVEFSPPLRVTGTSAGGGAVQLLEAAVGVSARCCAFEPIEQPREPPPGMLVPFGSETSASGWIGGENHTSSLAEPAEVERRVQCSAFTDRRGSTWGAGRDARDRAELERPARTPVSAAVGPTLSLPLPEVGAIGSGRRP